MCIFSTYCLQFGLEKLGIFFCLCFMREFFVSSACKHASVTLSGQKFCCRQKIDILTAHEFHFNSSANPFMMTPCVKMFCLFFCAILYIAIFLWHRIFCNARVCVLLVMSSNLAATEELVRKLQQENKRT